MKRIYMRLPEGIIKKTLQVYTFYGLVCRLNQRKKILENEKHSNLIIFHINDFTYNCNITTFVISTQVKVKTSLSIGKISFKCEHEIIDVEVT